MWINDFLRPMKGKCRKPLLTRLCQLLCGVILFGMATLGPSLAAAEDARQSLSKSMSECAAHYGVLLEFATSTNKQRRFRHGKQIWAEAAMAQAVEEGIDNPRSHGSEIYARRFEIWMTYGRPVLYLDAFRDWTSYCRRLAQTQDIDLRPPRENE